MDGPSPRRRHRRRADGARRRAGGVGAAARGPRDMSVPPLTWRYVPADRPDGVEKAIASRAHAVIVDLEDGVAPVAKEQARANLPELLGRRHEKPVYVRVNAGSSADLAVVAELALDGVVVPKVERADDLPAGLRVNAL